MDALSLVTGHTPSAVPTLEFAFLSDFGVAPDTYPQHVQPVQRCPEPGLRPSTIEKHLVDDDPGAGTGDGGQSVVPGCFGSSKFIVHDDGAVRSDVDRVRHAGVIRTVGHCSDQVVNSQGEPRPVESQLEAGGERRFPRAGTTIQDDDIHSHWGHGTCPGRLHARAFGDVSRAELLAVGSRLGH